MEQDLEVLDDMFVLENSLVIFNSFWLNVNDNGNIIAL
jgi:hypothetical protein